MKEFEAAARRLRDLRGVADPEIRMERFASIRPRLLRYQPEELVRQLEKLVLAGNVEQASRLIESVPPRRFPRLRQALANVWMLPAMLCITVIFALLGVNDVVNSKASPFWPVTDGVVLESRVVWRESSRLDYHPRTAEALVRFRYSVKNRNFEGQRISYRQHGTLPSVWVARYPVGDHVAVYYKPDDPSVSVLEPGFAAITYSWFAAAGLFLLFALTGLGEFREALRRRRVN